MDDLQFYINEIQHRPDGIKNVQETTIRNSFATGMAYFYDRCSKASGSTQFTKVAIIIYDSDGHVIDNKEIKTSYVAPTEGE